MPILEKPKINNLPFHLSKLVKGKRGKRNKAEINDTGKKKTIEKNNKTRSCNSKEKKNDKSLSTIIKKKKRKHKLYYE